MSGPNRLVLPCAALVEAHEARRVGPRQRLEEHAIGDAADHRRGRDAERHRRDHQRGVGGLASEQAERVAEVLHHGRRRARRARGRHHRRRAFRPAREQLRVCDPGVDLLRDAAIGVAGVAAFRARRGVQRGGVLRELLEHVRVESDSIRRLVRGVHTLPTPSLSTPRRHSTDDSPAPKSRPYVHLPSRLVTPAAMRSGFGQRRRPS